MSLPCVSCGCGKDEKKLKLEGDDEARSDLKADDDDQNESDEEPLEYDPDDWQTWPDRDVFIKYYQQLDESDGFDFDEYPGTCLFAPIYPILEFELFPKFVDRIKGYASLAINQHFGNDGKERTVTEIVKLNAGCPRDFAYYITFKIDNEGKEEIFQAKVVRTIERTMEVPICRRKD